MVSENVFVTPAAAECLLLLIQRLADGADAHVPDPVTGLSAGCCPPARVCLTTVLNVDTINSFQRRTYETMRPRRTVCRCPLCVRLSLSYGLFQDNVGGPPWMPGVTAFPRPTRYALQSQPMSPCRGSDPGSARKPRHRRVPAHAVPAAAAARFRGPHSVVGWRVRQPGDRGLGFGHVSVGPAIEQCFHQNTGRWNAPLQQLSLAEQMIDGGAHERYGVVAVSTPGPLTCRIYVEER